MSTTSNHPRLAEIDVDHWVTAATFTANGEHLVSSGGNNVRVWQVKDGKQVAAMRVEHSVACIAVSTDGQWIAAGLRQREVVVWDTSIYEQRTLKTFFAPFAHTRKVPTGSYLGGMFNNPFNFNNSFSLNNHFNLHSPFNFEVESSKSIGEVDFSPDSTRLVSAEEDNCTATIWDITTCQKAWPTLHHDRWVLSAKYSPQGDRIATASFLSVRVWDSNGSPLVDINVSMSISCRLLWFDDHLFVKTDDMVKRIDASNGSTVSEWFVPRTENTSRIAMPQHGRFIAYSADDTITFWDTSTLTQLGLIPQIKDINSIAFSPNAQLLAIAAEDTKIFTIDPSFIDPEILIDSTALTAWKDGELINAETSLSAGCAAMPTSDNRVHHALASRALVRVRLGQCDAALADAKESIEIQPSVIGYIAKCVALVAKGETYEGCEVCDTAFQHFHSHYFLLTKAIVLFMSGKPNDAISSIDDCLKDVSCNSTLCVVQAYMHLLLGNRQMESDNYEHAIQSFQAARVKMGDRVHPPPLIVTLITGWKFDDLAITIQQHLCEALWAAGRAKEAGEALLCIVDQDINMTVPTKTWFSDFKSKCCGKLKDLGDLAVNTKQNDEAISYYTTALSLNPATPRDLLVERGKAYTATGMWENSLNDANEVIKLEPSCPLGYERKYEALRGAGCYGDAIEAFETMLSKASESSDPKIRDHSRRYVRPAQTREIIRAVIKNAIHDHPLVLINTHSGRLCDRMEQAAAFESTHLFAELVFSITTDVDRARIEQVVREFYRYATFSHTWQDNEPLFEKVIEVVVYDLEALPTHEKLQMFCRIIREGGFNWAWSDTCCIDKGDHFVLQEALVSMFKWYQGSAITIIFLCDVDRLAGSGALTRSKWNSRGWTLQEYHASEVVQFYTKDWTPYLGLDVYNHKESPEIISEMEEATGISASALMALRPGLNDIREKLRLASTRQTTRVEDAAYSLLGIFSMSLPVTYGEGDKALGRLLSQLLTSSGDASILAWSGRSGSFNSCLPANIIVFNLSPTSHIPPAIASAEMETIIAGPRASSFDLMLATKLHSELSGLSTPFFVGQRMRLPCIIFKIHLMSSVQNGSEYVFHAKADTLEAVEISTRQNLSQLDSLYLIHPWVDFLLDRHPVGEVAETTIKDNINDRISVSPSFSNTTSPALRARATQLVTRLGHAFRRRNKSTAVASLQPQQVHILRFIARLRHPFGALLLTPTRRNVEEYKRVSAESLITVQVGEMTSATLDGLIQGVRMLDVL